MMDDDAAIPPSAQLQRRGSELVSADGRWQVQSTGDGWLVYDRRTGVRQYGAASLAQAQRFIAADPSYDAERG